MDMRKECKKCGLKQDIREMRYHPNGKDMLCRDCAHFNDPRAKATEKARAPEPRVIQQESGPEGVQKYYCRKCKYKFKRKEGIPMKACPYCGSPDIGPQKEISAQSILEDAASEDYYSR